MLVAPVQLIVQLLVGVFLITILGLLAALLSKAGRDWREWYRNRNFHKYMRLLRDHDAITQRQIQSWCRQGGMRREALLRAIAQIESDSSEQTVADSIPQRDFMAAELTRQLRSRYAQRRGLALLLLGYVGRESDVEAIAQCAVDHDGDVRLCAIRALNQLASPSSFESLVNLLMVTDDTNAQNPLAQSRIIERLANPWAVPYLPIRFAAIAAPTSPPTFESATSASKAVESRADNSTAIGIMRAVAISETPLPAELLVPWLRNGTLNERVAAVKAFAIDPHAPHTELLLAADDEAPPVRAQAVRALGLMQFTDAEVQAVLDLLTIRMADNNWWVRGYAAASMASLGEAGLVRLRQIAQSDDKYAAVRAAEQLALITQRPPAPETVEDQPHPLVAKFSGEQEVQEHP